MRAEGNKVQWLRLIVGGAIGSGKSTVLRMMANLGAVVIEADRIGHRVLEPDGAAFAEVAARWPTVIEGGWINRKLLANIVFSDPEQLAELEAMTHPHIEEAVSRQAGAAGDCDVAVELPIGADLLGPGWTRIVVAVPEELRIRRAVARGEDCADVVRRSRSQLSDTEWKAWADHVVPNVGTVADLEVAVVRLWSDLHGET
jgi:dephospho-CoA kinase